MPVEGDSDPSFMTSWQLKATVFADGHSRGVTWSSSDLSRVTVSSTGLVSSVRGALPGRAVITATSIDDQAKKAIANVTITAKGAVPIEIMNNEKRTKRADERA
ncbi:MAG TPA: hypothetical protein DD435_13660 [Cyanobacteria bacterium UBA8530]|nr:hypothetical protein [Cyanobacteria bacterium UBA8530]